MTRHLSGEKETQWPVRPLCVEGMTGISTLPHIPCRLHLYHHYVFRHITQASRPITRHRTESNLRYAAELSGDLMDCVAARF